MQDKTKRRVMIDEIAFTEAAAKLLMQHTEAAYDAGIDPTEAAALNWILTRTMSELAEMLFREND